MAGLAKTLGVPERQIMVDNVLTAVTARSGRRLSMFVGRIDVLFSVEVSGNDESQILKVLGDPSTGGTLANELVTASSERGLTTLQFTVKDVATGEVEEPMEGERPTLSWSSSQPEAETQVKLGIEITRGTDAVGAILIALPKGFTHWLSRPSDFRIESHGPEDLPIVSSTDWVDARYQDVVKILTEPGKKLYEGKYIFKFPALNPLMLPTDNVWRLCFCSSSRCDGPVGPDVLVTFAIPGFKFGERPWDWKKPVAGTIQCSIQHVYMLLLFFVLIK